MPSCVYPWKRFWCTTTGNVSLADDGYLWDPEGQYGSALNPDVVAFESLADIHCLALLGEPGIGKSYAMLGEQNRADIVAREEGSTTFWLDLKAYGEESRLVSDLFGDAGFVSWVESKQRLYVFLDSLDECLMRIETISALLIAELRKYPADRLYLRVACRTAQWPRSLEEGLRKYGRHRKLVVQTSGSI